MGWVMFYAGIAKIMDPEWTAAGFLKHATTFTGFYNALTDASILPLVDFANEWGLSLLGVSLILGVGVRLSAFLGAILMMLYYFPTLDFPMAGEHSYIIDDHVVYAVALLFLSAVRAGRYYGLESRMANWPILSRYPGLRNAIG